METDGTSRSSGSRSWQRASYRGRSGRGRKRKRKSWGERIADWTRALIAFLFSNVGIVCLVVGYTIAGAFLFSYIEGEIVSNIAELRNQTAADLWEFTSKNVLSEEGFWKEEVKKSLETYQTEVVRAIKDGYDGTEIKNWTVAGAFLYSLTVITTIGYGNICPRTKRGKVATIVYAIIGMPLFLLYLSNIGDILARSFKWTYARCCLCKCRRRPYNAASARSSQISNADPAAKRDRRWQIVNMYGGEADTSSLDVEETLPRDGEHGGSLDEGKGEDEGDSNDEGDDDDDESDSYDPQHVTVPLTLCLAIMTGFRRLRSWRRNLLGKIRIVFHHLFYILDARNGANRYVF
ncbi:TWiK family of potassium channels protein 9 [Solenopsis invicta]|uniref:TWiK family of potassium channels protein 9 n=1 Tax=Solenopsis invicta TaxID=13686 RepID=UPI00193C983A|nr:TWiK family of potassium channels protein 9 [Solenopsis invicta]